MKLLLVMTRIAQAGNPIYTHFALKDFAKLLKSMEKENEV
jgi:hypothetical protein